MKTSFAALALAVSGAFAYSNGTVYTTEIVNVLTTYCPAATQITQGGKTYTVTGATTLTITDCPCTVTKPMSKPTSAPASTVLYTSCPPSSSGASSPPMTKSIPPVVTGTYSNPLTVIYSSTPGAGKNGGYASGTGVKPSTPAFTGAASANKVGVVVGAVAGLAALAL